MRTTSILSAFRRQAGMSLMEVTVAMGVMAIGGLLFANMMMNQAKEQKALKENLATVDLTNSLTAALANGNVCKSILNDTTNTAAFNITKAPAPDAPQVIKLDKDNGAIYGSIDPATNKGPVIAKAGAAVSPNSTWMKIKDLEFEITSCAGNKCSGNWVVNIDQSTTIRPMKPVKISATITVPVKAATGDPDYGNINNSNITGCQGSGAGQTCGEKTVQIGALADGTPICQKVCDPGQGGANCDVCEAGTYDGTPGGSEQCAVCPVGTYSGAGATMYSRCAIDYIPTDAGGNPVTSGAVMCTKCGGASGVGAFSQPGDSTCTLCTGTPANGGAFTYGADGGGKDACTFATIACNADYEIKGSAGNVSCSACGSGTWSMTGTNKCLSCSPPTHSVAGSVVWAGTGGGKDACPVSSYSCPTDYISSGGACSACSNGQYAAGGAGITSCSNCTAPTNSQPKSTKWTTTGNGSDSCKYSSFSCKVVFGQTWGYSPKDDGGVPTSCMRCTAGNHLDDDGYCVPCNYVPDHAVTYSYSGSDNTCQVTISECDNGWIPDTTNSRHYCVAEPTCFVAGTKITMANGQQYAIETIKPNDWVQTYNDVTGKFEQRKVLMLQASSSHEQDLYHVELEDGSKVTPNGLHPFYVAEVKDYLSPKEIYQAMQKGRTMSVLKADGKIIPIKNIEIETKRIAVYNLDVDGDSVPGKLRGASHNFFAEGMLVHNGVFNIFFETYSLGIAPPKK